MLVIMATTAAGCYMILSSILNSAFYSFASTQKKLQTHMHIRTLRERNVRTGRVCAFHSVSTQFYYSFLRHLLSLFRIILLLIKWVIAMISLFTVHLWRAHVSIQNSTQHIRTAIILTLLEIVLCSENQMHQTRVRRHVGFSFSHREHTM